MNSLPILRIEGLGKTFCLPNGTLRVLDQLDLEVGPGESVSIRGESGSGKSTLLHLIAGLERAEEGTIYWGKESIAKWSPHRLARERGRRIGLVFQSYHLVGELNVLENVELAARIARRVDSGTRDRAIELLSRMGLKDRLRQMPFQMSGGERQRVAVARALLNKPSILLADEPTGNLDERTAERAMELFLQVVAEEGTALLLVTHSPHFASLCQRRYILHSGKLT